MICIKTIKMESSKGAHAVNIAEENKFNEILKNPETYFKSQPENVNVFKELSQKSYSYASCNNAVKGKSLSKLYVNGFDDEQIWQQSDLLNKDLSSNLPELVQDFGIKLKNNLINVFKNSQTKSLPSNKNKNSDSQNLSLPLEGDTSVYSHDSSNAEEEYAFDDDSDSPSELSHKLTKKLSSKRKSKEDYAFDDDSDSPSEYSNALKEKLSSKKKTKEDYAFDDDDSDSSSDSIKDLPKKQSSKKKSNEEYDFDDDSDSPSEFTKSRTKQLSPKKKSKYKSVVDDQFFKLSKLEDFLKIEDIKEERGDENASEDEIDLFQDIPSDEHDEDSDQDSNDESGKSKKSARYVMYDDFFDDPDSEIEDKNDDVEDEDDHSAEDEDPETLSDADLENGTDEENGDKFVSEINVENKTNKKSAFEIEQEKIKRNIQEYEKSMLQPLPWHLTGEVAAGSRPIDSLIDQETEFDSNMKKDLLVDKTLNEKIEELTIMALMNKAFSDVERKYKPTDEVINYKKEVALDQTKSKKSLAEVYEEDYLKKQNKQDTEEEDPKHKEIKKLMDTLFPQLHALFSHIPKPAIPEIKIVSNLPAITVEEVAPTSVSDATLLAPEEVKKKSGLVKGQTERTDTDRKRERRKKKIHQRLKEKKRMKKLEEQKANPSAKVSKLEKIQTLKKLKQHKNTTIASIDEGGKIKSSKDFFSRLQDTVSTKRKADNKSGVSSKKKK